MRPRPVRVRIEPMRPDRGPYARGQVGHERQVGSRACGCGRDPAWRSTKIEQTPLALDLLSRSGQAQRRSGRGPVTDMRCSRHRRLVSCRGHESPLRPIQGTRSVTCAPRITRLGRTPQVASPCSAATSQPCSASPSSGHGPTVRRPGRAPDRRLVSTPPMSHRAVAASGEGALSAEGARVGRLRTIRA
jgi:hypothetical protein